MGDTKTVTVAVDDAEEALRLTQIDATLDKNTREAMELQDRIRSDQSRLKTVENHTKWLWTQRRALVNYLGLED